MIRKHVRMHRLARCSSARMSLVNGSPGSTATERAAATEVRITGSIMGVVTRIDRIGTAVSASSWSACILGGIQPEPVQAIAREAADDGLLQRFCYVLPTKRPRGQDRKPDHQAKARYEALFPVLAALYPARTSGLPFRVVLHADVHPLRIALLDLAEAIAAMPDVSNRLKSSLGKWPGLFARLVLIFHLIEAAGARANEKRIVLDSYSPRSHAAPSVHARSLAASSVTRRCDHVRHPTDGARPVDRGTHPRRRTGADRHTRCRASLSPSAATGATSRA